MNYDGLEYLVVGCGFWGSVIAERIASVLNKKVLIIDKRNHIGGNSYSKIDENTGIEYHCYGTHIFHTGNTQVWDYINQFSKFTNYQHKVYTSYKGNVYTMPINLATINNFFGLNLQPYEATEFINKQISMCSQDKPTNLEEKAISLIGFSLYEAFIKGYTQKQWGKDPKELPSDIITRLPVRFNYNNNYFFDQYQGLPVNGYHSLFKKILEHKNIYVDLNVDYYNIKERIPKDCMILFTGPIDHFFEYKYGELGWRSLRFEEKIFEMQDYQGTSVMNYADLDIPYTRIHEFKHLHPERDVFSVEKTLICYEYPKTYQTRDEQYYPINDKVNNEKYMLYIKEADKNDKLIFGGRLGAYKYWDMDKAIGNALETFEKILIKEQKNE